MSFYSKIRRFLTFGLEDRYDAEILSKIVIINAFSVIGIAFMLFFTTFLIINQNFITAAALLIVILTIVFNHFYLKKTLKYKSVINLSTIVITSLMFFLLLTGNGEPERVLWFFLYPPFIIYFFDHRRGYIYSVLLIFFAGLLMYLSPYFEFIPDYPQYFKGRFIGSYLTVATVLFFIEFLYYEKNKKLEKNMLDSQKHNREKAELISKLSYQIRTPLSNILGITNILEETIVNDNQKDLIDTIEASVNNLVSVLERIDEASELKIESKKDVNLIINLKNTLSRTVDFYTLRGDKVRIRLNFDNRIPDQIIGNPIRIKQIFLNIIDLAIKNSFNDDLNIDIDIKLKGESDNQVIIIFTFLCSSLISQYNSDNLIDNDSLDLSITKAFIEERGGKFNIVSAETGTSFEFEMPFDLIIKAVEQTFDHERIKELLKKEPTTISNANILLVEDNDINQKVLELSLRKYVKNIDIANDGKQALELYEKSKYDVIIMDVQMPVMDGIKATKKIRDAEKATSTHTPIIAITANTLVHDKSECFNAGMDDYISKPFQLKEVIEKIEQLLLKDIKSI